MAAPSVNRFDSRFEHELNNHIYVQQQPIESMMRKKIIAAAEPCDICETAEMSASGRRTFSVNRPGFSVSDDVSYDKF